MANKRSLTLGFPVIARALAALAMVTVALMSVNSAAGATDVHAGPKLSTIVLNAPSPYKPKAPPGGGTDDYHCTLLNPHLTHNAFITSINFEPNSLEVHHEITYAVPPNLAAAAEAQNDGGKGWTCFGESGLNTGGAAGSLNGGTPWLTAWGPGHNISKEPAGTGAPMPAGTLVIMQEHYNMLIGDKPVRSKLTLTTVPASTTLRPLRLNIVAAPPDIPCAQGVTGPMCNRPAELATVGQRFGTGQELLVDGLQALCGQSEPTVGDTASCTWPMHSSGNIVELAPHMHLLGVGMKFVLNPGTPTQKTLLNVTELRLPLPARLRVAKASPCHAGRHHRDHLHLQPAAPRGAACPAQGAPALRDLGRRLNRRDVPRSDLHDSVQQRARVNSARDHVLSLRLIRAEPFASGRQLLASLCTSGGARLRSVAAPKTRLAPASILRH